MRGPLRPGRGRSTCGQYVRHMYAPSFVAELPGCRLPTRRPNQWAGHEDKIREHIGPYKLAAVSRNTLEAEWSGQQAPDGVMAPWRSNIAHHRRSWPRQPSLASRATARQAGSAFRGEEGCRAIAAKQRRRAGSVRVGRPQLPPSPTTTNGAQMAGSAMRPPSSMRASMARRSASARPAPGLALIAVKAWVMSYTVASLSTYQCDTSRAREPA